MSEKRNGSVQNSPSPRPFWRGAIAGGIIAALFCAAGFLVFDAQKKGASIPPQRTIAIAQPRQADPNIASSIEAETQQLIGAPRTITLTSEKARNVSAALMAGDYDTAQKIVDEVYGASQMRYGHFVPFNQLISRLPLKIKDNAFLGQLNGWVDKYPNSEIAYVIRALYFLDTAAAYRGTKFIERTSDDDIRKFTVYSQRSHDDLAHALQINADDPIAYYYLVAGLSNNGDSPALDEAFKTIIAKFPDYYGVYETRLKSLEPKWGGSVQQMYDFTETYAGAAADTSPVKLLYAQLYAALLNTAAIACDSAEGKEEKKKCIEGQMAQLVTPKLETEVHDALNLYSKNDPYLFSTQLGYILSDLVWTPGGEVYSGAVLQLAGNAMGSSNELVHDSSIHNNYILDQRTGDLWSEEQNYESAERKYQEALTDIQWMKFPSEEDKDQAIGSIYDSLAKLYTSTSQFPKAIAYAKAARAVGNETSMLACNGFYRLKNYADAVRECTARYEEAADMKALYYRAKSYAATGDDDDALKDDMILADMPGPFQADGVIDGGVVFGNRNDLRGMADYMNAHPFIFDEQTQSKSTLSLAYNNRCYAEMHLGELQKALDDCTISLKYGSLPDAYQKQQELVKLLANQK